MTISSTTRKAGPFIGNGSASSFPFTFKVFQASDLLVVQLDTTFDVESTLVLNTNYTVSLNANQNTNPGGTVTLSAGALAAGYTLTITSDIDNLQPTDLTNQGGFYPTVINDALDRATIQIQQLQVESDRSIKVPVSSTVGTNLPTPQANDLLGWNGDASALVNVDPGTLATVAAYATAYADTFTADGSTVNWTLTRDPATINNLDVSIDGVTQVPNVDYTLSGTTFSTTSTIPSGRVILVKYREGLPNMSADSQDVRYVPAGTGAQTTTVQAKLRETVSVKDFGAVGDGVTDDTAAIQAAIDAVNAAGGGSIFIPHATYILNARLYVKANVTLQGENKSFLKCTNASSGGDIGLHGDNVELNDLKIQIAGSQCLFLSAAVSNITIENCWLYDTGHTGIMFQANAAGCSNINIINNIISGGTYGVLFNSSLSGSGAQITGNMMYDNKCIELNTTGGAWTDTIISGNILDSSGSNGSTDAFAIGIAKGKKVLVYGNTIVDSYREAIHVEDDSTDIIIDSNDITTSSATEDGIRLLQVSGGTSRGHIVSNNKVRCTGTPSGNYGIRLVNDANGSVKNTLVQGNIVTNYATGMYTGAMTDGDVSGNLVRSCSTGISSYVPKGIVHDNVLDSCTTGLSCSYGTGFFGRHVFKGTAPTTLLSGAGSGIRGIQIDSSFSHTGGSTQYGNIIAAPSRYLGNASANCSLSANANIRSTVTQSLKWDGTTSTTTDNILVNNGGMSGGAVQVAGGYVQVGCYQNLGAQTINVSLELYGTYMV